MASSMGQAKAKGHAKTGGGLSTSGGPKNPHTQIGNKDRGSR